ncbi:MAG: ribonuclease P protein component [Propionibacteriaceae bacterium]|jgi:ribonuclease P protein component|nr:ribonuclease P protein component [Propionibacteriaceae bacterium]
MLPVSARLRRAAQFTATVRGGRQTGRACLILYVKPTDQASSRAGFVVSRRVGPAVVRNRVKRRLRHLVAARLDQLPQTADIVIRALPKAASQPGRLVGDFESAWSWAARQCSTPSAPVPAIPAPDSPVGRLASPLFPVAASQPSPQPVAAPAPSPAGLADTPDPSERRP